MSTFKNEFSWSVKRDNFFQECQRKYYFQYYGYWGGWNEYADARTIKIDRLRQLKTRYMWVGEKVHECIKDFLKNMRYKKEPICAEKLIEDKLNIMRSEFKNSKHGKYWRVRKTCGLFEHEYNIDISDDEWKKTSEILVKCINNFFTLDIYNQICSLADDQWIAIEDISYFFLDGLKIFVSPDFAIRAGNRVTIYDWKTGKVEIDKYKLQLLCYCLFASQKWELDYESIKTVEFYLSSGDKYERIFTEAEINSAHKYIIDSAKRMINKLENTKENVANENNFAFTDNVQISKNCNFQKVCSR
jgi:hypothetical protein